MSGPTGGRLMIVGNPDPVHVGAHFHRAAASMGLEPILVGDESAIADELARLEADLPVVHASQVIEMGEDPGQGLRDKPDSSISVCARMVAEGQAGAMIG